MNFKDLKPFMIIGLIFALIVIVYLLISPYQNCKRDVDLNNGFCIKYTSW